MNEKAKRKAHTRRVTSVVLDDGSIVEMVYRPAERETLFLISDANGVGDVRDLDLPTGDRLAPYSPGNNLLTHNVVLFASDLGAYESEEQLVAEVREFTHRYVDISETFEEIAAYYVLFTWIYDAFNELPYLRVRGDYGSGKSRFLLTVGSLCYKPIFASGASTVSPIFRLLDAVAGTLIIDEGDFRASDAQADIVKILNNGNGRGFPVLRSEATPTKEFNPTAFTVFGPKIVATRGPFEDPALENRCITEEMGCRPPRSDIPLNLPDSFSEEARELRNKLLSFRFRNRDRERDLAALHDRSVEPRISQILAPLLSTMETEDAKEKLRDLARQHSGTLAAERQLSVEAQVLEVVFSLREASRTLALKDIAEELSERFGDDYKKVITSRWVGNVLRRRFGLSPTKSHGTFIIPPNDYQRLDQLFEKYGLGDIGDLGEM